MKVERHPFEDILAHPTRDNSLWELWDGDIAVLIEDYRLGKLDADEFRAKAKAWEHAWRKKLKESARLLDIHVPLPNPRDRRPLVTNVSVQCAPRVNGDDTDIPQHLRPQKVGAKLRGPSR